MDKYWLIDIVAVISQNILIAFTFQDYLSQLFFFFSPMHRNVSLHTNRLICIHFTKDETINYIFYDAFSYSYHPETMNLSTHVRHKAS